MFRTSCYVLALATSALLAFTACSDDGAFEGADALANADSSSDPPADASPATSRLELGATAVIVEPVSPSLRLEHNGRTLLELPSDAVQLGLVEQVRESVNYDPYGFAVDSFLHPPPTLETWTSWTDAEQLEASGSAITLSLIFESGDTAVLDIEASAGGRFRFHLTPDDADRVAYYRIRVHPSDAADSTQGFYGLGEVFDQVDHRGTIRAMQLELDGELESGNNEAHVPVPLLIGTTGWGWFVEDEHPAVFDVAAGDPERVEVIVGSGVDSGDGLVFHLLAANHPLDVTGLYYEMTGFPTPPAPWALGPIIWRDENDDQAQVESDAQTIRDLDLATTGYWIDRPYARGVNTFDFEPTQFSDPSAMVGRLHALGFEVALWHTPYLDVEDDATAALRAVAESEGYYPLRNGPLLNSWGRPINLTNPDARAWWQEQLGAYIDLGIAGFKLDYGEDIVPGFAGGRSVWEFADGSDERTMHASFQRVYHSTYAELLPDDGGFLLCRGGTFGDQVNARIIWPGDLDASFARHRQEITEDDGDTYIAVGGLPAALVAGLSLGASGFPLYGSDTGGYRHSPPDKETFTRWFQMSALSTVMQVGTSTNDVPWELTERNGFDAEMLGWYREYARLHLRLFPYLWTYLQRLIDPEHLDSGRPIQRALGLAYPELGVHPSDTYLLGDHLLVAPVIDRGARTRELMLPEGEWVDWWTGELHAGPGALTVDAPLDTLPLFVSARGIVPMLRPTIDTIPATTAVDSSEAQVESFAIDPGRLHIVAARGAPAYERVFEVYDGTIVSLTDALADAEPGVPDRQVIVSAELGDVFVLGIEVELFGWAAGDVEAPTHVSFDGVEAIEHASAQDFAGAESGWRYDPDVRGGTLFVRIPADAAGVLAY